MIPLYFAPMEGITDGPYRELVQKLYPEWDFFGTDFLRVPTAGQYPLTHLLEHYDHRKTSAKTFSDFPTPLIKKTFYQILTSSQAGTEKTVSDLFKLGLEWLDLNLGCPSKTVVGNGGGSYLLSTPHELKHILQVIRRNFPPPKRFTCKLRVGLDNDRHLEENLRIIQGEGADAVTLHCRLRTDFYKNPANWDYLERALKAISIPLIANGDILHADHLHEITRRFPEIQGVMIGRGALARPWLSKILKGLPTESVKKERLKYFEQFAHILDQAHVPEVTQLRRFKSVSRDILSESAHHRTLFMRCQSKSELFSILQDIP